jgi:hypothetical protein
MSIYENLREKAKAYQSKNDGEFYSHMIKEIRALSEEEFRQLCVEKKAIINSAIYNEIQEEFHGNEILDYAKANLGIL